LLLSICGFCDLVTVFTISAVTAGKAVLQQIAARAHCICRLIAPG